jgi:hypothetical protein
VIGNIKNTERDEKRTLKEMKKDEDTERAFWMVLHIQKSHLLKVERDEVMKKLIDH